MQGTLIAAFLITLANGREDRPHAPQWPSAATFEFTITDRTEEFELKVKTYYSAKHKSIRFETWDGLNQVIINDGGLTGIYSFPTYANGSTQYDCVWLSIPSMPSPFPDFCLYEFAGNVSHDGVPSSKWVSKSLAAPDDIHVSTIWIQQQGESGSDGSILVAADSRHYAISLYDTFEKETSHSYIRYYNYNPGEPDPKLFKINKTSCGYFDWPGIMETQVLQELLGEKYLSLNLTDRASVSQRRRDIYERNRKLVESHNQLESGYKLELNRFAHLTEDEIQSYKGLRTGAFIDKSSPFPYSDEEVEEMAKDLPESWDWRIHGAVTKVKDQRVCGSCWAFSTIGALEGANFLKTGDLVELSEQFLVDCIWNLAVGGGCLGGLMNNALSWIKDNGGVMGETQYGEYLAENGRCRMDNRTLIAPIKSFTRVMSTVNGLKVALVNHGPIVVSIAATEEFVLYKNGVFKPSSWGASDHGVVLVGYGVLNGESYWMIKNSWGKTWGLEGYGLISMDYDTLNLLNEPYYITL